MSAGKQKIDQILSRNGRTNEWYTQTPMAGLPYDICAYMAHYDDHDEPRSLETLWECSAHSLGVRRAQRAELRPRASHFVVGAVGARPEAGHYGDGNEMRNWQTIRAASEIGAGDSCARHCPHETPTPLLSVPLSSSLLV